MMQMQVATCVSGLVRRPFGRLDVELVAELIFVGLVLRMCGAVDLWLVSEAFQNPCRIFAGFG